MLNLAVVCFCRCVAHFMATSYGYTLRVMTQTVCVCVHSNMELRGVCVCVVLTQRGSLAAAAQVSIRHISTLAHLPQEAETFGSFLFCETHKRQSAFTLTHSSLQSGHV